MYLSEHVINMLIGLIKMVDIGLASMLFLFICEHVLLLLVPPSALGGMSLRTGDVASIPDPAKLSGKDCD